MKIGLAIAPGPFMIWSCCCCWPTVDRPFRCRDGRGGGKLRRLRRRRDRVGSAGRTAPRPLVRCPLRIPSGIGVGLTLPTLMGVGTSALPASSFATGSGVINMVRQIGFAVGVAIFVAIVGSRRSAEAHMAAFRLAWWVMTGITALGCSRCFCSGGEVHPAVMEPRKSIRLHVARAHHRWA